MTDATGVCYTQSGNVKKYESLGIPYDEFYYTSGRDTCEMFEYNITLRYCISKDSNSFPGSYAYIFTNYVNSNSGDYIHDYSYNEYISYSNSENFIYDGQGDVITYATNNEIFYNINPARNNGKDGCSLIEFKQIITNIYFDDTGGALGQTNTSYSPYYTSSQINNITNSFIKPTGEYILKKYSYGTDDWKLLMTYTNNSIYELKCDPYFLKHFDPSGKFVPDIIVAVKYWPLPMMGAKLNDQDSLNVLQNIYVYGVINHKYSSGGSTPSYPVMDYYVDFDYEYMQQYKGKISFYPYPNKYVYEENGYNDIVNKIGIIAKVELYFHGNNGITQSTVSGIINFVVNFNNYNRITYDVPMTDALQEDFINMLVEGQNASKYLNKIDYQANPWNSAFGNFDSIKFTNDDKNNCDILILKYYNPDDLFIIKNPESYMNFQFDLKYYS